MCGIFAIHIHETERDLSKLVDGYKILTNRGPDTGGINIYNNVILGFRRLAIMDTSSEANQPFVLGDTKLLCNGEIYNHEHLKKIYDIECKSKSDCECILHLYRKLGFEKVMGILNGDFAIVISHNDKIYFGRDRIGVRPLFYGITYDNNFAWASYARALTGFCKEIYPVLPGWGEFNCVTRNMILYPFIYPSPLIIADNKEQKIRDTLIQSTKDRLMSDRPLACLLSGGLDSSLITSITCKLLGAENVRTYSIGMSGSQDLMYARKVADFLGTKHTEILFTAEEGFEVIPDVIRDIESYDITTIRASVAMWLAGRYISKNTDDIVLFSGEGADELFCGYLYFHYAPNNEELHNESLRLLQELYLYDVLRADRCISSHGLELRVPFLDRRLIDVCLALSGKDKSPQGGMEKAILRNAFTDNFLPAEILWRRKDGMSDGVSGDSGQKWYQQIQNFIDTKISNEEFGESGIEFPNKEAYYYKKIYDEIFPNYQPKNSYWLPKWVEHNGDPSGRNLSVFTDL